MVSEQVEAILDRARETLRAAELGLERVKLEEGPDRLVGLRNLIVFGRSVTNVLQNLRSTDVDFDDWYTPYREEMEADPLLSYFYDRRSEVLKEGKLETTASAYINELNLPQDLQRMEPRPPNVTGFFIADQYGGSGWEVETQEGEIEKYYVKLPDDVGEVSMHLPEAPTEHLGEDFPDTRVKALAEAYYNYLEELVESAEEEFG